MVSSDVSFKRRFQSPGYSHDKLACGELAWILKDGCIT
jgi:hypothetical protein